MLPVPTYSQKLSNPSSSRYQVLTNKPSCDENRLFVHNNSSALSVMSLTWQYHRLKILSLDHRRAFSRSASIPCSPKWQGSSGDTPQPGDESYLLSTSPWNHLRWQPYLNTFKLVLKCSMMFKNLSFYNIVIRDRKRAYCENILVLFFRIGANLRCLGYF